MAAENCQLPTDAFVKVDPAAATTLRGGSSFAISTARCEVHGDPLHRTDLPPTLKGFFFSGRIADADTAADRIGNDHDSEETEDDDAPLPYLLPAKNYGRFADLLADSAAPIVELDPTFSFLTNTLPGIDYIYLIDSRNGLLLFGHLKDAHNTEETCYIVCNPATEQWVNVPGCGRVDPTRRRSSYIMHNYLMFDPAVSSHFNVVLFWEDDVMVTVQAYSSETGEWGSEVRQEEMEPWRFCSDVNREHIHGKSLGAMVDGMLYLIFEKDRILQVDAQGMTPRIITAPVAPRPPPRQHQGLDYFSNSVLFVGQSQGRLHCIVEEGDDELFLFPSTTTSLAELQSWKSNYGLSIWVLQDLDTLEWVLKGRVSYLQLFGKSTCQGNVDYRVAVMHPDRNLVFFIQHRDCQMILYDIDGHEVRALDIDFHRDYEITPYVPYVSELFLGVIGGHKLAH
ncbi:unnamed protein product [Urochloa humidicola]